MYYVLLDDDCEEIKLNEPVKQNRCSGVGEACRTVYTFTPDSTQGTFMRSRFSTDKSLFQRP